MKTFIVPVDFSETARNAAIYAAQIAAAVQDSEVILYNAFNKSTAENSVTGIDQKPISAKESMELAMASVKTEMLEYNTDLNISCFAEQTNSFIDALTEFALDRNADLIIMGISESNRMEQILAGSHTLEMVNRNVCPVIIVPPHSKFTGIKNILLASDFKDVEKTMPAKSIQTLLNIFKSDVHVVNVDSEHFVELTSEYKEEKAKMDQILQGYNTQYSFIRQYDFVEAIGQFAADKDIDLILTVPRKHSLLSKMFVTSNTKKLAYQSELPIVAVHS